MQLSLDPSRDLDQVTMSMRLDRRTDTTTIMVTAQSRNGQMLGSFSRHMQRREESELLPMLAYQIAMGWLYGGSEDVIKKPNAWFAAQRQSIRNAVS